MCGIAGIVRFDDEPIGTERPEAMRAHLRHRGPDGQGIEQLGRCALVHTRLSIIDLLGGRQPMQVSRAGSLGGLALVFNGEIYNHRKLRQQLERLGHRFESDHCDTEVLLFGYRQWGEQLPKHLHGMFAFAIWDQSHRRLFLCRDRAGKKPLYVHWSDGGALTDGRGELMFASLVGTLIAAMPAGRRPPIDRGAMLTFLRFGYTHERSLMSGVNELPAGHWMSVEADGRSRLQRYWQPPPISRTSTSLGAVKAAREVIEEAVTKRLEADVPLGCFLSGGIDSSIVAALSQRELTRRGQGPLKTFCVKMPDADYDESPHAAQVARHIGAFHTELFAEPAAQTIDDLRRLIAVMGEPTADSSIVPTFWLSRATRAHVKVVLSGDGGDELFGGYDRYRAMRLMNRYRWWLRRVPAGVLTGTAERAASTRFRRLVEAADADEPFEQYYRTIYLFSDEQIRQLGMMPDELVKPPIEFGVDWPDESDPAQAAMRWDLCHYLPFDLLRKMDAASMAVALEVRCPLLDTQVCDLAAHLPTSVLMPGGRAKGLLRQVAGELLPESIVRRPKRGFAVPIGRWFRGPLRKWLAQYVMEGDLGSIGVDRYTIETMLEEHVSGAADHSHRLFALLMLSLWLLWLKDPVTPPVEQRTPRG